MYNVVIQQFYIFCAVFIVLSILLISILKILEFSEFCPLSTFFLSLHHLRTPVATLSTSHIRVSFLSSGCAGQPQIELILFLL